MDMVDGGCDIYGDFYVKEVYHFRVVMDSHSISKWMQVDVMEKSNIDLACINE